MAELNILRDISSFAYQWRRPILLKQYVDEAKPRLIIGRAQGVIQIHGHPNKDAGQAFEANTSWMECGQSSDTTSPASIKIISRRDIDTEEATLILGVYKGIPGAQCQLSANGSDSHFSRSYLIHGDTTSTVNATTPDPGVVISVKLEPITMLPRKMPVFGDQTFTAARQFMYGKILRKLIPGQLPTPPPLPGDNTKTKLTAVISDYLLTGDISKISGQIDISITDCLLVGVEASASVEKGNLQIMQEETWICFIDKLPTYADSPVDEPAVYLTITGANPIDVATPNVSRLKCIYMAGFTGSRTYRDEDGTLHHYMVRYYIGKRYGYLWKVYLDDLGRGQVIGLYSAVSEYDPLLSTEADVDLTLGSLLSEPIEGTHFVTPGTATIELT